MNVFHLYYLLSQACLFEVSDNFRSIAFEFNESEIKIYFILNKKIEDDLESINQEIISEFEILLDGFLDSSNLNLNYSFNHHIVINDSKEFNINELSGSDKIEVLFMKRW